MRKTKNKRLKQVMASFVKHMHAFVRDVKPTHEEWFKGIQFLTETGHWSTGKRQEFILMSDTLGVSMLVDALNYKAGAGATQSTVLGPFHREQAPEFRSAHTISKNATDGEPCRGHRHGEGPEGQAGRGRQARHLGGAAPTACTTRRRATT